MNDEHQWSDAWLLLSIIHASKAGEANLKNIIAAGDGIEHAIFNPEELQSGFARLTTGGYIREDEKIFYPTEKTMKSYLKTMTPRRSIYKQLEDTQKLLNIATDNSAEVLPNAMNKHRYDGFSKAAYLNALREYRKDSKRK
jgi:hypothetical protein